MVTPLIPAPSLIPFPPPHSPPSSIKFLFLFHIFQNILEIYTCAQCFLVICIPHFLYQASLTCPQVSPIFSWLLFSTIMSWQSITPFFLLYEKNWTLQKLIKSQIKKPVSSKSKMKIQNHHWCGSQSIIHKCKEIISVMGTVSRCLNLSLAKSLELGRAVAPGSGFPKSLTVKQTT